MVLQIVNSTITGSGVGVNLTTNDNLLVGTSGLIASVLNYGVFGAGDWHTVRVQGTVAGYAGIFLGYSASDNTNETVLVTDTGFVTGTVYGVYLKAWSSTVTNYGLIDSDYAVYMAGARPGTLSRIENFCTLHGKIIGVTSEGSERLTIMNMGTISGRDNSIYGSLLDDTVRNLGHLNGNVSLNDGDDTYDGRGGTVEGVLYGGAGKDTFRLGAGNETVDGGDGSDTLDFRIGGAIKVALDGSFANTKAAADDTYSNIENIIGSRFGNDVLRGDAAANDLSGLGG